MVRMSSWIQVVLVAALPALGCFPLATDNPGEPPLDAKEADGVLKCQHIVKARTLDFVNTKLRGLQRCSDLVLATLVRYENGLISEDQVRAELAKTENNCEWIARDIRLASTRMIDGIVEYCEPVEELVFSGEEGGDPLGVVALYGDGWSTEEWAGFLCGTEELLTDVMMSLHVPRVNDQMFAQIAGFEDSEDLLYSVFDATLDERCILPIDGPVPEALSGLVR